MRSGGVIPEDPSEEDLIKEMERRKKARIRTRGPYRKAALYRKKLRSRR